MTTTEIVPKRSDVSVVTMTEEAYCRDCKMQCAEDLVVELSHFPHLTWISDQMSVRSVAASGLRHLTEVRVSTTATSGLTMIDRIPTGK